MASIGESRKMGTSTHAGKTRAGLSGSMSAELSQAVYKVLSAAIGRSISGLHRLNTQGGTQIRDKAGNHSFSQNTECKTVRVVITENYVLEKFCDI